MIGYILTTKQYEQIQGVYFTPDIFFNCVQDINETWFLFLSEQDKELLPSEYHWIIELPKAEYEPKPSSFPL